MGSYILFQFTTLKKKVGPYIILALSILVIGVLAVLSARAMNNDGMSSVKEISTFTKFFPFLFGVLFSAFVIAHVFKEGESDGSELIVVAKPLSRKQIVFGKFALALMYILAYQLIMFVAYVAFTHADSKSTEMEKMKWALSLFIGGLIVQIIASAIIIMLASVLGKVGTIVVSILIAAILPILSYTLVPLGKGWGFGTVGSNDGATTENYAVNLDASNGDYVTKSTDDLYRIISNEAQYNSYRDKRWYDEASYFDIWYHWGRFYSMFMPTATNSSSIVKWEAQSGDFANDKRVLTFDQGKFLLLSQQGGDYKQLVETNASIAKNVQNYTTLLATKPSAYDSASLLQRALFLRNNGDANQLTSPETSNIGIEEVAAELIAEKQSHILQAKNIISTSTDKLAAIAPFIVDVNKAPKVVKAKDYIPTYAVLIVWSVIGLGMCAGALAIYSKRDFK